MTDSALITFIFSADFVFSNWLLMYLQDEEVKNLIKETLFWLREDGYLFCRESCYHQSGTLMLCVLSPKLTN